jgi:hypothetical protein
MEKLENGKCRPQTKDWPPLTSSKGISASVCQRKRKKESGFSRGGTGPAQPLAAARAFAFAASSSRFFGGALVSSERRRPVEIPAMASTAARNEASLVFDGLLNPLIFLTNWSEAARISSALTGGSKLKRVLIFLHIAETSLTKPKCGDRSNSVSASVHYGMITKKLSVSLPVGKRGEIIVMSLRGDCHWR